MCVILLRVDGRDLAVGGLGDHIVGLKIKRTDDLEGHLAVKAEAFKADCCDFFAVLVEGNDLLDVSVRQGQTGQTKRRQTGETLAGCILTSTAGSARRRKTLSRRTSRTEGRWDGVGSMLEGAGWGRRAGKARGEDREEQWEGGTMSEDWIKPYAPEARRARPPR